MGGDEGASTDAPPVTGTTASPTNPPPRCHKDGPNALEDCSTDFLCCKFDPSDSSWEETACTCNNGNVFVQDFDICSWPDMVRYSLTAAAPTEKSNCHQGLQNG